GLDRTDEPARVTGTHRNNGGEVRELVAYGVRVFNRCDLTLAPSSGHLVDLALRTLGPRGSKAPGKQVVARVAVLDLDDFAGCAEPGDFMSEDKFACHDPPPYRFELEYGRSAISRAFLIARAILRCS